MRRSPHSAPVPLGLLLLGALVLACARPAPPSTQPAPTGPPWFQDVTEQVGLDFTHDAGPLGSFFMPQSMGSGAALFDFDNDGRLDILLLQGAGPDSRSTHRLYRQGPDGRFHDVSRGSGLDVAGYGTGVAVGDVNNDGWPDVVIVEYGGLKLFLNNGDGKSFTDVTRTSGLDSVLWSTSAAFCDFDRDGFLDLVVVNYVSCDPAVLCHDPRGRRDFCHPRQFPGSVTKLFRNTSRQSSVRFEDVTESAGLSRLPGPGLGVLCADFTGDGWPDIFVANDGQANRLWVNRRNGTFQDEAVERGLAFTGMGQAFANMGVAIGDVDGDGLFDVFVTHLTDETHTLWCQNPRGMFRDRTVASGLTAGRSRGTGFGTVLADFDHDGRLDVAIVNGRVSRGLPANEDNLGPFWSQYAERNQLFAGEGSGKFRDRSGDNPDLCGTASVARGLACGDVDGDGALDLLVTTVAGRALLYRNVAPTRGHWLMVRALDRNGRDATGAEVTVRAADRSWQRWADPGYSYQCSNDPRAHFGLGEVTQLDAIVVRWPNGSEEVFPGGSVDRVVVLRQGGGKPRR